VKLQQEALKGNSEGNNTDMMMKKRKTFMKSPTKKMLLRKIRIKDRLINIIWCLCVWKTRTNNA
jgi:hypothetical protein